MRSDKVQNWTRLWRTSALLAGIGAAAAHAGEFTLEHVVAGGGASHARSTCFTLDATVGQPAIGQLSNAEFVLSAGFWAAASPGDSLFQDSFEECRP